jgi:hypothetical protein
MIATNMLDPCAPVPRAQLAKLSGLGTCGWEEFDTTNFMALRDIWAGPATGTCGERPGTRSQVRFRLTGCRIYGVSAWGLKLDGAKQQDLVITPENEPEITVDNIEVAQFVYLLLHNQKICDVINTITSKAVLILGRFTKERKAVLDALRDELRNRNLLPI